jgi:trimethylamine--corrinoid protein Co-methyltransferase
MLAVQGEAMNSPEMEYLSRADVEAVHRESLRILREVGVKLPNKTVLDAFKRQGAEVDFNRQVVHLPDKLVMEAVQTQVDNNAKYYGQELRVRNHPIRMWMSMGNLKYFIDPITNERRTGTLRDLVEAIVVANALENLEKVSCFGIPAEYHGEEFINILRYYLLCLYSKKRWFLTPIESVHVARCMLEMASIAADSEAQVRDGSLIYFEVEPIKNLEFAQRDLDILVEFARRKVTVFTTHWGWLGYHTPMTYAALLSLANANILAGIAAIIVLNPDNLYLDYLFPMHAVNPKSMNWPSFGGPNQVVISFLARQLADFYGFRFTLSNCFFSDSIGNDFQLGFERGVTAALSIYGGIDRVGVQGIVGADAGLSLEQLIVDNEMLSYINFILGRRICIDEEMFDFESIRRAGPGGSFQDDPKNAQRKKEIYWDSDIFAAVPYENWVPNLPMLNARRRLQGILAEGFPPPPVLGHDRVRQLDAIMERYAEEKSTLKEFRHRLASIMEGEG